MARYFLENGIIHDDFDEGDILRTPDMIFHLSCDGAMQKVSIAPHLKAGEGLLMYEGDLYIEPLEVQIEFIKAAGAEQWLEGLLQRHAERVREFQDSLWVLAEIGEVT